MGVKRFSWTVLSIRAERATSPRPTGAKEWERMKVGTITENGAGLIYRALKAMESDISGFRKKCEERGMQHAVADCNDQLRELRGNGSDKPGLLAVFAPQLDAFAVSDAARLDGAGEPDAGGQIPLEAEMVNDDNPDLLWSDTAPRPRPKRGDKVVLPHGETLSVVRAICYDTALAAFEVRALTDSAPEGAGELPYSVVFENGEWRDAVLVYDGAYQQRNEQLIEQAQRKLGDDVATDADVSVNGEGEQGTAALTEHYGNGAEAPKAKRKYTRRATPAPVAAKSRTSTGDKRVAVGRSKALRKGGKAKH